MLYITSWFCAYKWHREHSTKITCWN